jgi:methylmalonyl-CoA mutase C-terminal domain/subunit
MPKRKIRVVIAKLGLDGHDRGAKYVARSLRDAGMEVIYTGLRQTVEQTVATVIQESADVLGLSFMSGDHMVLMPKIMAGLKEQGAGEVLVIAGGIILPHEAEKLLQMGVKQVFHPGAYPDEIIKLIEQNIN